MRQLWLEKMAEDGLIRKEAVAHIYTEVDTFMKQAFDYTPIREGVEKGIQTAGKSFATAIGAGGAVALGAYLKKKFDKSQAASKIDTGRAAILQSRNAVLSQFSDPDDLEKAQARFNEVMLYSPHIAMNPMLASKIVKDNLHSGISDTKASMLALVQSQYTKNMTEQTELSKMSSVRPEVVGEMIADSFNMAKTAASITGSDLKEYLKIVGLASTVPLAAAAISGIGSHISGKLKEKELKEKLDDAFHVAVKQAPEIHKEIFKTNMDDARQYFNAMAHFAPHAAMEPHAARAFMIRMINHYNNGGMDINDVKNLTEIERSISGTSAGKSTFGTGFQTGYDVASGGPLGKGIETAQKKVLNI
jgi:hypothetical protein